MNSYTLHLLGVGLKRVTINIVLGSSSFGLRLGYSCIGFSGFNPPC